MNGREDALNITIKELEKELAEAKEETARRFAEYTDARYAYNEQKKTIGKLRTDIAQLTEALKLTNGKLNKAGIRCSLAEQALKEHGK